MMKTRRKRYRESVIARRYAGLELVHSLAQYKPITLIRLARYDSHAQGAPCRTEQETLQGIWQAIGHTAPGPTILYDVNWRTSEARHAFHTLLGQPFKSRLMREEQVDAPTFGNGGAPYVHKGQLIWSKPTSQETVLDSLRTSHARHAKQAEQGKAHDDKAREEMEQEARDWRARWAERVCQNQEAQAERVKAWQARVEQYKAQGLGKRKAIAQVYQDIEQVARVKARESTPPPPQGETVPLYMVVRNIRDWNKSRARAIAHASARQNRRAMRESELRLARHLRKAERYVEAEQTRITSETYRYAASVQRKLEQEYSDTGSISSANYSKLDILLARHYAQAEMEVN